jgi:predicted HNH restriction endonuclease
MKTQQRKRQVKESIRKQNLTAELQQEIDSLKKLVYVLKHDLDHYKDEAKIYKNSFTRLREAYVRMKHQRDAGKALKEELVHLASEYNEASNFFHQNLLALEDSPFKDSKVAFIALCADGANASTYKRATCRIIKLIKAYEENLKFINEQNPIKAEVEEQETEEKPHGNLFGSTQATTED